jgi:hypothetical protein
VLLGDGSSKTLQKNVLQTKIVSKSFYKKIDKQSKTDFFSIFLITFWAFLGEGSSKTRFKKNSQTKLTNPGTFLASEEPANHPKVRKKKMSAPWCLLVLHNRLLPWRWEGDLATWLRLWQPSERA